MIPNITFFNKTISAYMIMALAGVMVTLFVINKLAKKSGMDVFKVETMYLIAFIGVVIGGHLLCGVANYKLIIRVIRNIDKIDSIKKALAVFNVIFGSSTFYGGLIGAILASWIYIKKKNLDKDSYFDIGAVAIPLFHTFGRIGCFLSGCCYGIECSVGFVYHNSIVEAANGVRRFPVQLVEAAFNLCLFLVLRHLFVNKKAEGKLMPVYLMSYSCARFILEFFRGDSYRGLIGGISYLQILSVVIFAAALFVLIRKVHKEKAVNQQQTQ